MRTLLSLLLILISPFAQTLAARAASGKAPQTTTEGSAPIFVFQDNFWVNLHHFLRAEAHRSSAGAPLELPLTSLKADERAAWQSSLSAYAELAKKSFIFDETLTQMDNALAIQTGPVLSKTTSINSKFLTALNNAAAIYREYRWNENHAKNQQWIASHAPSIGEHAPSIKATIGKVFEIKLPQEPILVDLVRDIGLNLAYTTQGPPGFSGHTFISAQANANPDVALDTILHEISHTMDDPIIVIIDAETARQHVQIPPDMWHAITLYTTGELVRHELGRSRSDPSYAPNEAFSKMFTDGTWQAIFIDLQTYWLPYLNGKGTLKEALAAVITNAPR